MPIPRRRRPSSHPPCHRPHSAARLDSHPPPPVLTLSLLTFLTANPFSAFFFLLPWETLPSAPKLLHPHDPGSLLLLLEGHYGNDWKGQVDAFFRC